MKTSRIIIALQLINYIMVIIGDNGLILENL
jgi:hypothetical protein